MSLKKKLRVTEHKDVDDAVFQLIQNTRASRKTLRLNGPLMMEKADILAAKLGHPDFKASQEWLNRFKKRYNILFKAICGESAAVQQEQVDSFMGLITQMRTILDTYETRNIFNADETGMFWKFLPDKTMAFQGEACQGGKKVVYFYSFICLSHILACSGFFAFETMSHNSTLTSLLQKFK